MSNNQIKWCQDIISTTNKLMESLEPVPSDPPPLPALGDSVSIGGVILPIITQVAHGLCVVDPRPVLREVEMITNDDKANDAFPRNPQVLGKLVPTKKTHGNLLDWQRDVSASCYFGRWISYTDINSNDQKCNWSVYFNDIKWLGVMSSGLRPGGSWKLRAPSEVDPVARPNDAEWFFPAMSKAYMDMGRYKAPYPCKCGPWAKRFPTLTFVGSFAADGRYISEAILQLH